MQEVTTDRFIALFDIMGFKDLIYRSSHKDVLAKIKVVSTFASKMRDQSEEIKGVLTGSPYKLLCPIIFSDTILFATDSNTELDLNSLIYTSSLFLGTMLNFQVPIKGAVSRGVFTCDRENSIYVGRPLVDAYLLAEEVNFYGAVLHHSAEIGMDGVMAQRLVCKGKVPMKQGLITHRYLNLMGEARKDLGSSDFDERLEKLYDSASGAVRKYVDNTKDVYAFD